MLIEDPSEAFGAEHRGEKLGRRGGHAYGCQGFDSL